MGKTSTAQALLQLTANQPVENEKQEEDLIYPSDTRPKFTAQEIEDYWQDQGVDFNNLKSHPGCDQFYFKNPPQTIYEWQESKKVLKP